MPPNMKTGIKSASKPVFKTENPYTQTTLPQISPSDQTIILDLLCNLLEPLGRHRKTHHSPSTGKSKPKKRKRRNSTTSGDAAPDQKQTPLPPPPPPPPLAEYLTIGLNSTTRHLEALAALSAPTVAPESSKKSTGDGETSEALPKAESAENSPNTETHTPPPNQNLRPLSLLILPTPNPPSSLPHAHLPTLVYLSSLLPQGASPSPSRPQTRLILLPSSSESRIASVLHLPRVGALGIMEGAPGADALVSFVRERVGEVRVEWLEEAKKGVWKGVNVAGVGM
ncbi:hypothetical protein GQ43DRAFT_441104 [Delitschia confertaspora ATCC 74209]|uniref:Uncharacterized protein n=1 Tax=Delitschia confertaspora ATCC 74209 TaxID=1513339 RepID=A0A9P4JPT7_9PLEO|nr:hypothetical protein GQ43DRAFT_441104 [Delitschia confertaspora ATCC 74209]